MAFNNDKSTKLDTAKSSMKTAQFIKPRSNICFSNKTDEISVPVNTPHKKIPRVASTILSRAGSSLLLRSGSITLNRDVEPAEKSFLGALTAFRGRGYYLHRLELFRKAKVAYDEAYRVAPENIDLLIGRSNVCTDDLNAKQALQDANAALARSPRNLNALHAKARAMAVKRQFEHSVILNYQGLQRRRQPPYFAEGISDGIHCIKEAIGAPAGQALVDFLPVLKRREQPDLDEHALKQCKHVSRIPKPRRKRNITPLEAHKQKTLSRVLAHKYLGPMAEDKFFLEDLLKDPRIKSANSEGSREIRNLAEDALHRLDARQKILREQRPYYTIRNAEKTESKHETKHKRELLIKEREMNAHIAKKCLKKVDACWRSHRIGEMMKEARKMQGFLDSKTQHTFPNKNSYVDHLYRAVGEGYLSQYRLSFKISERGNRRRVAFLMGIRVGRATSYDSVYANYPRRFFDPREDIKSKLESLEVCESATMKCWIYYELARLMCTVKDYARSKIYGKRCQHEAEQLESTTWWLNGCFALIAGDMQQGNANEVKILAGEAVEWAKESPEPDQVLWFLDKCVEMCSDLAATEDTEQKELAQREREILKMIDESVREDVKYLFKRISMVPSGRRFSVLPVKSISKEASERRKRHQRHISIIPGPTQGLPRMSRTPTPGLQIFD